jgi:hypothetical protein
MTDDRIRRVGENEALYRLVNERIERLRSGPATMTSDFAVICECANLGCTTQIMIKTDVYERTLARSATSSCFVVINSTISRPSSKTTTPSL